MNPMFPKFWAKHPIACIVTGCAAGVIGYLISVVIRGAFA